jgi:hypothetical protein
MGAQMVKEMSRDRKGGRDGIIIRKGRRVKQSARDGETNRARWWES